MNEQNLIIVGNGDYARMMKRYLGLYGYHVCAYTVDFNCIGIPYQDGIPVISLEELERSYQSKDTQLVMGIGYRQMGKIRRKVFAACKALGYDFFNYIHPTAIIERNVKMGEGNNILEGVILEEGVSVGDANLLFGGSMVAHESRLGNFNTLSVKSVIAGCTTIHNNCFVGAAAVVRDHITIADYSLIGAGAYASQSSEKYQVIVPVRSTILDEKKSVDLI